MQPGVQVKHPRYGAGVVVSKSTQQSTGKSRRRDERFVEVIAVHFEGEKRPRNVRVEDLVA